MKWSEVDWSLQDAAGDGPEGGERISQSQESSQDYIKLSNEYEKRGHVAGRTDLKAFWLYLSVWLPRAFHEVARSDGWSCRDKPGWVDSEACTKSHQLGKDLLRSLEYDDVVMWFSWKMSRSWVFMNSILTIMDSLSSFPAGLSLTVTCKVFKFAFLV